MPSAKDESDENLNQLTWGLGLVTAGSLFLMDKMGFVNAFDYWYLFPAMIALHGVIAIISGRTPAIKANGCFNLICAFWLYASIAHLWDWTFRTSWPLLIIAFGLRNIVCGLLTSKK